MEKFTRFARIAETEFSDVVISTHYLGHKLRIYFKDKSFVDFFFTTKLKKLRFAIHLERSHLDKSFYRVDNTPDPKWGNIKTFPMHFHNGKYNKVKVPPFEVVSFSLESLFRKFLIFTRSKVIEKS